MLNRLLSIFLLVLATAVVAGPTFAQSSSAKSAEIKALLQERDAEIKRVLGDRKTFTEEQRENLKVVINDGIDFEAMSRTALGPFWSEITPAQKKEFVEVFSDIVRNQSLSNLDVYRARVSYGDVEVTGETARAVTTTVYKDVPTEVVYVLGSTDGEWRVRDIVLDDVSTADGYARSFQTVIRKRGFDALMTSLHKKLDGMSS